MPRSSSKVTSFHHRLTRRLFEWFARLVLRVYCPLEISGAENLPPLPFLICSNHSSHLDSIVLMTASGHRFKRFGLLAAKDYFFRNKAVYQCFASMVNLIPLERTADAHSLNETISLCRAFLEQSVGALILFPTGTRSSSGELGEFKRGTVVFAIKLGLPIVPAYIQGTGTAMPKGRFFPKPCHLSVHFAEPVFSGCGTTEDSPKMHQEILAETHRRIAAIMTGRRPA